MSRRRHATTALFITVAMSASLALNRQTGDALLMPFLLMTLIWFAIWRALRTWNDQ